MLYFFIELLGLDSFAYLRDIVRDFSPSITLHLWLNKYFVFALTSFIEDAFWNSPRCLQLCQLMQTIPRYLELLSIWPKFPEYTFNYSTTCQEAYRAWKNSSMPTTMPYLFNHYLHFNRECVHVFKGGWDNF